MPRLEKLWKDNYQGYGARKLWKTARRAGMDVGRDQTARLMRRAGICGWCGPSGLARPARADRRTRGYRRSGPPLGASLRDDSRVSRQTPRPAQARQ